MLSTHEIRLQQIENELSELDFLEAKVDVDYQSMVSSENQQILQTQRQELMNELKMTFSSYTKFNLLNKIDQIEAKIKEPKDIWQKRKSIIEIKRRDLRIEMCKIQEIIYKQQTNTFWKP